jgi:hypothetical protein
VQQVKGGPTGARTARDLQSPGAVFPISETGRPDLSTLFPGGAECRPSWRQSSMQKLLAVLGATVGGAIGWWLGAKIGMMTAFIVSIIGTAIGTYYGAQLSRRFLP